MDLQEILIQTGLSEKEAQVYLTALELGQFSMTAISAKSKTKRPTCYLIIEQLIEKGLVSKMPQAKRMMYVAESPDRLENQFKKKYLDLKKALPLLKTVGVGQVNQPEIKFFRGKKGVEAVYNQVLIDSPQIVCSIMNTERLFSVTGKQFLDDWIKTRAEHGIHIDSLMTIPEKKEYFYGADEKMLRKTSFLPKDTDIGGALWFYGDNVVFVSGKEDDFSFIVHSQEFKKTMQSIFDLLKKYVPLDRDV